MRRMLLAIPTMPLLLACAACGGNARPEIVKPPMALTACADEPLAPDLPPADWSSVGAARTVQAQRDETTLAYILALRSAWGDCAAKVAGVKAWSERLSN